MNTKITSTSQNAPTIIPAAKIGISAIISYAVASPFAAVVKTGPITSKESGVITANAIQGHHKRINCFRNNSF